MTRPNSIRLNCESLEARDVPAVFVEGTAATPTLVAGQPPAVNGAAVTIREVAFAATDLNVVNQAFSAFETTTRSATAADKINIAQSGSTLTIKSSDGIFVRFTANGGQTFFHNRGTTLTINSVTGLNVNLQLGGNDKLVDKTNLDATLIGGPGIDTIIATGGAVHPFVVQQLSQPGGASPAQYSLLATLTPQKTLLGQTGGDTLIGPRFGFKVVLHGGKGSDNVTGGLGPDILLGGAGVDVLRGFGGRDTYNTIDNTLDYIFNQPGDAVAADPFDIRSSP
jgi:hypothetical protein